jgi:zinc transport system ATP-binding protein
VSEEPCLLRCDRLAVGYGGRALLPPIDVTLRRGEFWAIVGRNGCGKTTWFRTVLGLTPAISGRVERAPDLKVAYVPQRTGFDDVWPLRVRQVVAMGTERGLSFLRPFGMPRASVREALDAVGAGHLSDQLYRTLSEGQKQRVLLARMIASGASLAMLDEPTAAMDVVAEREALDLLGEVRRRYNLTIIVVSHFLGVARDHADRVLLFDRDAGQVVAGTAAQVFAHPVFQARYGAVEA